MLQGTGGKLPGAQVTYDDLPRASLLSHLVRSPGLAHTAAAHYEDNDPADVAAALLRLIFVPAAVAIAENFNLIPRIVRAY